MGLLQGAWGGPALAQARATGEPHASAPTNAGGVPPRRAQADRFAGRARAYYRLVWGIDDLNLKVVESGEIIRFTWRVLDAGKAGVLNDRKLEPVLIDPAAGVQLSVPVVEKIGPLRQSLAPEAGKSYWMAFSNKGTLVKPGDHVTVVVGPFRADGLVVD